MNLTEKKKIVQYMTWIENWSGAGRSFDCQVEGRNVWSVVRELDFKYRDAMHCGSTYGGDRRFATVPYAHLHRVVSPGDYIKIDVYSNLHRYWIGSFSYYWPDDRKAELMLEHDIPEMEEMKSRYRSLRDSQRSRVYSWEWNLGGYRDKLTLEECRDLRDRVYADFGILDKAPVINLRKVKRNSSSKSWYWPGWRNEIELHPRTGLNGNTLVHELAHALVDHLKIQHQEAHGPEFVEMYVYLARHYMPGRDPDMIDAALREMEGAGVKMAQGSFAPPTKADDNFEQVAAFAASIF